MTVQATTVANFFFRRVLILIIKDLLGISWPKEINESSTATEGILDVVSVVNTILDNIPSLVICVKGYDGLPVVSHLLRSVNGGVPRIEFHVHSNLDILTIRLAAEDPLNVVVLFVVLSSPSIDVLEALIAALFRLEVKHIFSRGNKFGCLLFASRLAEVGDCLRSVDERGFANRSAHWSP